MSGFTGSSSIQTGVTREDWAVVSSARTDEVLKVIVANPIMIEAYKGGIPNNGKPFPDGSRILKLQWKPGHACHVALEGQGLHLPPVPEALNPVQLCRKEKSLGNGHGAIWPCPGQALRWLAQ